MEPFAIVFWVLFAIFALIFIKVVRDAFPYEKGMKVSSITSDAFFLAIIILMGLVPQLGYITIVPGLSLTLLHLPVLIGAYKGGWKKGILFGLAFGLTSWFQALSTGVGFNAFFIYPWVSILPRLVFGFLAGLIFSLMKKMPKIYKNGLVIGVVSFLLTVLHTGLVFGDLFIFFPNEMIGLFQGSSILNGVVIAFGALIGLGCVGESLLSGILVPLVGKALRKLEA